MSEHYSKLIDADLLPELIELLSPRITHTEFIADKYQLWLSLQDEEELRIRLPLQCRFDTNITTNDERPFLLLIVESGQAALAYGEGKHIIEHKVFKSYMVRKKQGKSQIKHLKTKGKSKAGSRVRLANTIHFFEEIREKVEEWLSYFEVEYIGLSCTKSLYPHLFTEEFELDRRDERVIKIPKHIQEANFENLLEIHTYLLQAELMGEEEFVKEVIRAL